MTGKSLCKKSIGSYFIVMIFKTKYRQPHLTLRKIFCIINYRVRGKILIEEIVIFYLFLVRSTRKRKKTNR